MYSEPNISTIVFKLKAITTQESVMQVNEQGQVVIPPEIRDRLGIAIGTELEIEVIDDVIQLRKKSQQNRGKQLVEDLRGKAPFQQTTDEIMQLTRGDD